MVKNLESVKENIRNYILQGDYDEAEILLKSHLNDIKEYVVRYEINKSIGTC